MCAGKAITAAMMAEDHTHDTLDDTAVTETDAPTGGVEEGIHALKPRLWNVSRRSFLLPFRHLRYAFS